MAKEYENSIDDMPYDEYIAQQKAAMDEARKDSDDVSSKKKKKGYNVDDEGGYQPESFDSEGGYDSYLSGGGYSAKKSKGGKQSGVGAEDAAFTDDTSGSDFGHGSSSGEDLNVLAGGAGTGEEIKAATAGQAAAGIGTKMVEGVKNAGLSLLNGFKSLFTSMGGYVGKMAQTMHLSVKVIYTFLALTGGAGATLFGISLFGDDENTARFEPLIDCRVEGSLEREYTDNMIYTPMTQSAMDSNAKSIYKALSSKDLIDGIIGFEYVVGDEDTDPYYEDRARIYVSPIESENPALYKHIGLTDNPHGYTDSDGNVIQYDTWIYDINMGKTMWSHGPATMFEIDTTTYNVIPGAGNRLDSEIHRGSEGDVADISHRIGAGNYPGLSDQKVQMHKGFTDEAILGMILNAEQESNINPGCWEADYLCYYYIEVEGNDNAGRNTVLATTHHRNWNTYVLELANINDINLSAYHYKDIHGYDTEMDGMQLYYPGVGLWQWTGERAYAMEQWNNMLMNVKDNTLDTANDAMWSMTSQIYYVLFENYGSWKGDTVFPCDLSGTHKRYAVDVNGNRILDPVTGNIGRVSLIDWGVTPRVTYTETYYVNMPNRPGAENLYGRERMAIHTFDKVRELDQMADKVNDNHNNLVRPQFDYVYVASVDKSITYRGITITDIHDENIRMVNMETVAKLYDLMINHPARPACTCCQCIGCSHDIWGGLEAASNHVNNVCGWYVCGKVPGIGGTLECTTPEHTHGTGCHRHNDSCHFHNDNCHRHDLNCYDAAGVLTCTEDECTEDECTQSECTTTEHTHTVDCYHTHTDACKHTCPDMHTQPAVPGQHTENADGCLWGGDCSPNPCYHQCQLDGITDVRAMIDALMQTYKTQDNKIWWEGLEEADFLDVGMRNTATYSCGNHLYNNLRGGGVPDHVNHDPYEIEMLDAAHNLACYYVKWYYDLSVEVVAYQGGHVMHDVDNMSNTGGGNGDLNGNADRPDILSYQSSGKTAPSQAGDQIIYESTPEAVCGYVAKQSDFSDSAASHPGTTTTDDGYDQWSHSVSGGGWMRDIDYETHYYMGRTKGDVAITQWGNYDETMHHCSGSGSVAPVCTKLDYDNNEWIGWNADMFNDWYGDKDDEIRFDYCKLEYKAGEKEYIDRYYRLRLSAYSDGVIYSPSTGNPVEFGGYDGNLAHGGGKLAEWEGEGSTAYPKQPIEPTIADLIGRPGLVYPVPSDDASLWVQGGAVDSYSYVRTISDNLMWWAEARAIAQASRPSAREYTQVWEGSSAPNFLNNHSKYGSAVHYAFRMVSDTWASDNKGSGSILDLWYENMTTAQVFTWWQSWYRNYCDTGEASFGGIADCAVSWAWLRGHDDTATENAPGYLGGGIAKHLCTELYVGVKDVIHSVKPDPIGALYSSCDRGVCTAVSAAGADDNFPWGNSDMQYAYAMSSDKWEDLGIVTSMDMLEPGDLVLRQGHVIVFTGGKAASEKWPNEVTEDSGKYGIVHSSLSATESSSRGPRYDMDGTYSCTSESYHAFRLVGEPDENSLCRTAVKAAESQLSGLKDGSF